LAYPEVDSAEEHVASMVGFGLWHRRGSADAEGYNGDARGQSKARGAGFYFADSWLRVDAGFWIYTHEFAGTQESFGFRHGF
jgi:hypothetical protein